MKNITIKIVAFLILASTQSLVPAEYNLYSAPGMSPRDKGFAIEQRLEAARKLSIPEIQAKIKEFQDELAAGKPLLDSERQLDQEYEKLYLTQLAPSYAVTTIQKTIDFLKSEAAATIKKIIDNASSSPKAANESYQELMARMQSDKRAREDRIAEIQKKLDKDIQEKQKEKEALQAKEEQVNNEVREKQAQLMQQRRALDKTKLKQLHLRNLDLQVYNNVLQDKLAQQPKQPAQPAAQPQPALDKQAFFGRIYKNIESKDPAITDAVINADIRAGAQQFGAQSLNAYIAKSDRTLMQHAAMNGRLTVVNEMLKNGANPNSIGASKQPTPLILSLLIIEKMSQKPDLFKRLEKINNELIYNFISRNADVNKTDPKGRTAYEIAQAAGLAPEIVALLNPAKGGAAAAAPQPIQAKNPADTQELLNKLTDAVELHDKTLPFTEEDEKTNATRKTKIADARKATDKLLPEISTLLRTADVQTKDASGYTALHLAVMTDNPAIVNAVLNAGGRADLHTQDNDGKTPAALAAELNYNDIAKLLK